MMPRQSATIRNSLILYSQHRYKRRKKLTPQRLSNQDCFQYLYLTKLTRLGLVLDNLNLTWFTSDDMWQVSPCLFLAYHLVTSPRGPSRVLSANIRQILCKFKYTCTYSIHKILSQYLNMGIFLGGHPVYNTNIRGEKWGDLTEICQCSGIR